MRRTYLPSLLALPALALLLGACQDHRLPTAVAPDAPAFSQQAGHCEVSDAGDSGAGTLRALIADAACTTITFGLAGPIELTSGQLEIDRTLNIEGPGGGGIWNAGTLTLTQCTVSKNSANDGVAGGIANVDAASAHGDTEVGSPQRRRVIDPVAGDGDDLALRLEPLHDAQLVLGRHPGIDVGFP
jgi:hypothetical protein